MIYYSIIYMDVCRPDDLLGIMEVLFKNCFDSLPTNILD
jgi:hypothetical protein